MNSEFSFSYTSCLTNWRVSSALLFTHNWRENNWIHTFPKGISAMWNAGFELVSPCPFPTTITITPRAPPFLIYGVLVYVLLSFIIIGLQIKNRYKTTHFYMIVKQLAFVKYFLNILDRIILIECLFFLWTLRKRSLFTQHKPTIPRPWLWEVQYHFIFIFGQLPVFAYIIGFRIFIHLACIIFTDNFIYKVGDRSGGWFEGSLYNSYYTEV